MMSAELFWVRGLGGLEAVQRGRGGRPILSQSPTKLPPIFVAGCWPRRGPGL